MANPFVGEIKLFAGNFAIRNYAFCDGQLLQIASNTALFSLFGTTFGGDGRTTFGVPDMRSRAPVHPGTGPGLTPRSLGQKTGFANVTLSVSQMPSHNHLIGATDDFEDVAPEGHVLDGRRAYYVPTSANVVNMASTALENTGDGQSHENHQPYLGINFLVALTGTYPSRN